MSYIQLETVYEVPHTVDEGGIWYRCLDDMRFATSRVGWAVGSTQILCTQDGGKTWINQYKDYIDQTYLSPNRVYAISAKICWITAITSPTRIRCCYTKDGGLTWKAKEFETEIYPRDIFFKGSKLGWIVSDDGRLPAHSCRVLFSEDAGESWKAFNIGIKGNPDKIRFLNAKQGWLLEDSFNPNKTETTSKLHISYDGGCSWQINKLFDRWIRDLYILSKDCLFVTGEHGFIAKTINGGESWKRLNTRSQDCIETITFYNRRKAMAVGSNGAILLSEDEGETWEAIEKKNHKDYEGANRAHFTSASTGVLTSSTSIYSFKLS